MKIAFIMHSYHKKTQSSEFFIDFLRGHGADVVTIADDSWIDGQASVADDGQTSVANEVLAQSYDLIIVWQMEHTALSIVRRSPWTRLLFVPMFDGCHDLGEDYWRAFRGNARVLSFCRTLHERLRRWRITSVYAQYFPNPADYKVIGDYSDLRGFFWQRRETLAWNDIRRLLGETRWSAMHIHAHFDPSYGEFSPPSSSDTGMYNITVSKWFENKDDFDDVVRRSNVYFAPRMLEGIGMSFLEAMARGQCVVAPGYPTMSEYITDGVSGVLYDPRNPQPLDFYAIERLGKKARLKVESGYEVWSRDLETRVRALVFDEMLPDEFGAREDHGTWSWHIRHETRVKDRNKKKNAGNARKRETRGTSGKKAVNLDTATSGGHRTRGIEKASLPDRPLVTVAIVTFNSEESLEETLKTITQQTYENIEIVVVDGASEDGTLNLIRKNDQSIDYWVSEPDDGPYYAMNKAAVLAHGHWIVFINSGDVFYTPTAVEDALRDAPADGDFIIGHHIYLTSEKQRVLHKANDFAQTWSRLLKGHLSFHWLSGIPCHQATFTRPELIRQHKYDVRLRFAADHDFMYRMRSNGAKFHHADTIVAVYTAGGLSFQNQVLCQREWWRIARKFGVRRKVDRFFRNGFGPMVELNPGFRMLRRIPLGAIAKKVTGSTALARKALRRPKRQAARGRIVEVLRSDKQRL